MDLLTVCIADGLVRAELVGAAGVACWHRDQKAVRDGEMLSWDGGRQAALAERRRRNETRQGSSVVFQKEFEVGSSPIVVTVDKDTLQVNVVQTL